MGYIKAENVLPDELVALIQNYIDGEYVYIPRKKGTEKSWGEANGTKKDLNKRNREIYSKYCAGIKVDALANEYYLSPKTIIKIFKGGNTLIELRKITESNFEECIMLRLTDEQQEYIASNAYSLAEAYAIENGGLNKPIPYAIYNDELMVGFLMTIYQPIDANDPEDDEDVYYLPRLMIDKKYQGNGYGKDAMKKIIEIMKTFPYGKAEAVVLSCSRENKVAYELYKALGFVDTGEPDGYGDYYCRLDF